MTEFTVETVAFRMALTGALEFASSDATLPSINAVQMAATDDGKGIEVVATDRYVLSVEPLPAEGAPFTMTVPYDVAKRLLTLLPRPRRGQLVDNLVAFAQDDDGKVTVRVVGDFETALTFTPLDKANPPVQFVNYRELVEKMTGERSQPADLMAFNPRLLGRVCRVFAARGGRTAAMRTSFGGHLKPVFIEQEDDALRLYVMPIRVDSYMKAQAEKDVA